jgi:hypothetical protein
MAEPALVPDRDVAGLADPVLADPVVGEAIPARSGPTPPPGVVSDVFEAPGGVLQRKGADLAGDPRLVERGRNPVQQTDWGRSASGDRDRRLM